MPPFLLPIFKFAAKWLLPIFLQFFWPLILVVLQWVVEKVVTQGKEKISDWLRTRTEKWEKDAARSRRNAEQQAELAQTDVERHRAEARADAWKEIAEQLRRENTELQLKMQSLEAGRTGHQPLPPPKID